MPTGWPFLAHTMAQLAWPAPLPASFFAIEQAISTTSPLTVISEAFAGIAIDATNAAAAIIEIKLRIGNTFFNLSRERSPLSDFPEILSRRPGLYFVRLRQGSRLR